ncbi:MAG: DNA replication/repair protein RecF [Chloroflexi bacterium]|nr:DNA replication/repair protein RecF [Chloroflexota bacterium]MDA1227115.1 DNA replication/repair protein RecF [Chloroflexota bacterium]
MSLLNFRNYEHLELDLKPGMVLFQGDNGQGKSNLLEAIYMLAVAKSPRASSDRELVKRQLVDEETYSRVAAIVERGIEHGGGPLKLQMDFSSTPIPTEDEDDNLGSIGGISVQKYIRINGVPRRASTLVGQLNAVMFSAEDLELVYGPPSVRRRYMDILISQLDQNYLRALQRYQRVITQRNSLLKAIREGRSAEGELAFWDEQLVSEGEYIIGQRRACIQQLSEMAGPIQRGLSGNGESMEIIYQPNVSLGNGDDEGGIAESMHRSLLERRRRELAQGVTVTGPHRDDLIMLLDGMDVGAYASRGQSRTVVLAMKLAEAGYLKERRGQEPILLLDDVLSELDVRRREHVLDQASQYQQSFLTTAEVDSIDAAHLSGMNRFAVKSGHAEPMGSTTDVID